LRRFAFNGLAGILQVLTRALDSLARGETKKSDKHEADTGHEKLHSQLSRRYANAAGRQRFQQNFKLFSQVPGACFVGANMPRHPARIKTALTKITEPAGMKHSLLLPLFLSACVTPAPDYFGATRHEVRRGGIDFVVFQRADEVEVVRRGYLSRAARAPVPQLMSEAAEEATGCRVIPGSMSTKIPGDTGVARFDLKCGG
jgi:hypothetical protein